MLKKIMKEALQKLFNIYQGENKSALLFALLGFLWSLGVTSGLKFADALFLLHVGADSLPIVYQLTACSMLILSSFLLYAFHVFRPHNIFIFILIFGITFYGGMLFLIDNQPDSKSPIWVWFAMRIFGALFFSFAVTCFWTFVDQYYHLQDAKRLYTLFNSCIFLGVACTGAIMNSGWLNVEHLLIFIITIITCAIVLISFILKVLNPASDPHESVETHLKIPLIEQIKQVLKSPFTLLLMTGNFLTYVLLVITEYNYMSSFDQAFDPGVVAMTGNEQDAYLTQFLGKWLATVSVTNLIFGLFLYSRLIHRFGIGGLVICTPIILLFTFSGWIVSDALLFPIMGLFVVEGTLYVIDDSNFNLLLNAVPSRLKYKIRLMIESFFEPIGMLVSSLLLSIPAINSKVLGWILASLLLIVCLFLRKHYLAAIYQNLSESAIHFRRSLNDWLSKMTTTERLMTEEQLLAFIQQGKEKAQLMAAECLLDFIEPSKLSKLLEHSHYLNESAKIDFLNKLATHALSNEPLVIDYLENLVAADGYSEVKGLALIQLAERGYLNPEKIFANLASDHLLLKSAAIIACKHPKNYSSSKAFSDTNQFNYSLAEELLKDLLLSKSEIEVCMGLRILAIEEASCEVNTILPFLNHSSLPIVRAATKTLSQISPHESIKYSKELLNLLKASNDDEIRIHCLKALGKIDDSHLVEELIFSSVHFRPNERRLIESIIEKMGSHIVPSLIAITKNNNLHNNCRLLAGKILGCSALSQLRENLYEIIHIESKKANFYFYHYHNVPQKLDPKDDSLLKDALLSSYRATLDFIIQILGVAGEIEDCELLSRSIRSPHPKIRSQVVETLERSCETSIFRLVWPLVSDLPLEEKFKQYFKEGYSSLTFPELLEFLENSPIQIDQIVAATLKYRLNTSDWQNSLIKQMSKNEDVFQRFAKELLNT